MKIPFFRLAFVMGLSISFSILLLAARIIYSEKISYIFFVWNLFLALVPFICSIFIYKFFYNSKISILFAVSLLVWLAFFPNAPYIVTDLIHLKVRSKIPYWYDILLVFSFAFNGMILALASLRIIHIVLLKKVGPFLTWVFLVLVFFLTGFGIYLGRFLRWNSWDLIRDPITLVSDIFIRFSRPMEHPATFGLTFVVFWFMLFSYLSILLISEIREENS